MYQSIIKSSMEKFLLHKAFTFFEPGPVVLVSTSFEGEHNIMTMSWHMLLDFTPVIACCIGPWDYTYEALTKTGECVLSIPGADIMKTVVDIGNCSGKDVDKFEKFGLTPVNGEKVKVPLIGECLFNLECVVKEEKVFEEDMYMFLLEGVCAWQNPYLRERPFHAKGDGNFIIEGRTVNLKDRMTKWKDVI